MTQEARPDAHRAGRRDMVDLDSLTMPIVAPLGDAMLGIGPVLDQLTSPALVLALDGTIMFANRPLLLAVGVPAAGVVGVRFCQAPFWVPDATFGPLIRQMIASATAGETVRFDAKVLVRGEQPATFALRLAPVRNGDAAIVCVVVSATDTGPLAAAREEERRASEQLDALQLVYDGAPVGLAVLDRSLRFVRLNHAFAAFTDTPIGDHLGQSIWSRVPEWRAQLEPHVLEVLGADKATRRVEVNAGLASSPGVERHWAHHVYALPGGPGRPEGVGLVVEEVTRRRHDEVRLRDHQRLLEHRALHDALTGLPNRALMADRAQQAIATAKRKGERVALLMLDLDEFKSVNDTLGHAAGDSLLAEVGRRLRDAVRDADTVGRLGGDEFAVITGALDVPDDAVAVADRILRALEPPVVVAGRPLCVRVSIGVAMLPGDARRLGGLFKHADLALYEAKRQGGRRAVFFERTMRDALRERRRLEQSLKAAAATADLHDMFETRHAVADGRTVGVELVPMWRKPGQGLAPLRDDLVFAERKGLGAEFAIELLRRAKVLADGFRAQGQRRFVCVALSPRQIVERTVLEAALPQGDECADGLRIEILTGRDWPLDDFDMRGPLERLVDAGVLIGLRGFGADHVAFHELRHLPLDSLTLECDLIREVGTSLEADAFVAALAGLGRRLGKRVVATGVATEARLRFLGTVGCEEADGPVFARGRGLETTVARRTGPSALMPTR